MTCVGEFASSFIKGICHAEIDENRFIVVLHVFHRVWNGWLRR